MQGTERGGLGWREAGLSLSFLGAYGPVFGALQLLVLHSINLHVGPRQVQWVFTRNENLEGLLHISGYSGTQPWSPPRSFIPVHGRQALVMNSTRDFHVLN